MRKFSLILICLWASVMIGLGNADAGIIDFNFDKATPVGSWQEREQITTDEKGKQTGSTLRISYLGQEERDGEIYVWTEMETNNFKVKKKGRKPQGDPVYVKVLMKKSVLEGDISNSLSNFSDMAVEVIMQTGDSPPMRIKGAGSMMGGMAQAIGLEIKYTLTRDGNENVTVPAGSFECGRYRGQGSTSAKVVFKTINVESTSTQWISNDVPFGMVKVVSDDVVNGEKQHSETVLTAFGQSGATSKITGEPQEMPSLGNIFGG
jgi:hypothetical protein